MAGLNDRPVLEQGFRPLIGRSMHVVILWLTALGCFIGEGIYVGAIDRDFENYEHEFPVWLIIFCGVSVWSFFDIRHAEREYVEDYEHDMKRYLVMHGKEHELEGELAKIKHFRKYLTHKTEEELAKEEKKAAPEPIGDEKV
mmetsp:Transcript_8824/g.32539  ORF Transcript_8824/g.32539 Transcript_8824/m.32539 type:complete len:142 (+) Transcript_8824:201-626(+)